MPELPEVETVRRDLQDLVVGATVRGVSVTGERSVRRQAPSDFQRRLTGRTLVGVDRWGKYLLVRLSPGDAVLVVHLRMSGQLLLMASGAAPTARHTHIVLRLTDGRELRFVDPRTFGEMFVTTPDLPELARLGPDALAIEVGGWREVLAAHRSRLKYLLLDQHIVAGIGNIYSDEILWHARLRGTRQADRLRPGEAARLNGAVSAVLAEAIARRGSSLGDGQYVDLGGETGRFQLLHEVYGRAGLPCRRCGRAIERTRVAQRSHFWCRGCQK